MILDTGGQPTGSRPYCRLQPPPFLCPSTQREDSPEPSSADPYARLLAHIDDITLGPYAATENLQSFLMLQT